MSVGIGVLRPLDVVATILSAVSVIFYVVLLLVISSQPASDEMQDTPPSAFLRTSTKVAMIAWALVVAGNVVRLIALPFIYFANRQQIALLLPQPPTFMLLYGQPLELLFDFASVVAAPYIVFKSFQEPKSAVVSHDISEE